MCFQKQHKQRYSLSIQLFKISEFNAKMCDLYQEVSSFHFASSHALCENVLGVDTDILRNLQVFSTQVYEKLFFLIPFFVCNVCMGVHCNVVG
jgi:hypothetical protein